MDRLPGLRTCLYDDSQLRHVMEEMARRIVARVSPDEPLALVGILRRGAPLADRLCEALAMRCPGLTPLRLDLKIKRYADDLSLLHPDTRFDEAEEHRSVDLAGYTIVVVDDVLYTGHSVLRAVTYLEGKHPQRILVATLADRCVARLPLRADVVGVRLQLAEGDVVECSVPPYEADFRIELFRPSHRA